ncbi:hypothetical protein DES53_108254 [Roseimicrobium gellanilyticum]|uniref:Uncharacterized protein n=1 Tax=Roseimicrobium gellanilyticum TaxID=748857 RepID=A0A366HDU6_9BACT|nr:hypothetical protein [Roseimicrobium gellanilyticum]RBP40547.1 hypothetical protein DES53_108254 [Roseimicrobium gellanilyticum]
MESHPGSEVGQAADAGTEDLRSGGANFGGVVMVTWTVSASSSDGHRTGQP